MCKRVVGCLSTRDRGIGAASRFLHREEALKLTNVLPSFHSAICKYVQRGVGSHNNGTANTNGSVIEELRKELRMRALPRRRRRLKSPGRFLLVAGELYHRLPTETELSAFLFFFELYCCDVAVSQFYVLIFTFLRHG